MTNRLVFNDILDLLDVILVFLKRRAHALALDA
jgi:hypothetical protein